MKTAVFIHKVGQVGALEQFVHGLTKEERAAHTVVALGADVEYALEARSIAFESGKNLCTVKHAAFISAAAQLAHKVLEDPSMAFWTYRGIALKDIFTTGLHNYFFESLYFFDALVSVVEPGRFKRLVLLYTPGVVPKSAGIFAPFGISMPLDVARTVCAAHGVELVLPGHTTRGVPLQEKLGLIFFTTARAAFGVALSLLNVLVAATTPRKKIRILASDYWKNIGPLMRELPEAEVVLLDRSESRRAGLRAIWRHRMRFVHVGDFVSRQARHLVRQKAREFTEEWQAAKGRNKALSDARFRGHAVAPLLIPLLDSMLCDGSEQALTFIEGAHALLKSLRPDVVWVRASVSAQIHFSLLCYVARSLGIPSLEAQHGLEYLGSGSISLYHTAEYIAVYGSLITKELRNIKNDSKTIEVGSPRFDVYAKSSMLTPAKGKFTVLCVMPAVFPAWSDTYEILDYLRNLKLAVANIPNAELVLKLRPGPDDYDFFAQAIARELSGVPHRIARYEPMPELFAQADAVSAIFSTTLLEALISGKPVVYNGTFGMHGEIDKTLSEYISAGALCIAHTVEELQQPLELWARDVSARAAQVSRAAEFMKNNYSFDGRASKKLADTIRNLVREKLLPLS